MEKMDDWLVPLLGVIIVLCVLSIGFSIGVRTTGLFGLEEQEPLIEKQGFCWTSTEYQAVPFVEPQDKVLVITDINE